MAMFCFFNYVMKVVGVPVSPSHQGNGSARFRGTKKSRVQKHWNYAINFTSGGLEINNVGFSNL